MRYRRIPRSDLKVSAIGLGTASLHRVRDVRTQERLFSIALAAGVNHFDFAPIYCDGDAEKMGGKCLSSTPRDRLVLTTKVFHDIDPKKQPSLSAKNIRKNITASLKRLKTEYVDVLYLHRFDPTTPLIETLTTLGALVDRGMIRHWGTSEWPIDALFIASAICEERGLPMPLLEQRYLSLARHSDFKNRLKPNLKKLKMSVIAHSALGGGILGGRYDSTIPRGSFFSKRKAALGHYDLDFVRERTGFLDRSAKSIGLTRVQLALSWSLSNPGVCSVLVGATSPSQLEEILARDLTQLPDGIREKLTRRFRPL